jgi:hypothetical protein
MARLYTESAPMPLEPRSDLTGVEIFLPEAYDEATDEPLFGLKVWEEHDVYAVHLGFLERDGDRYLVELTATVAESVFSHPVSLHLRA